MTAHDGTRTHVLQALAELTGSRAFHRFTGAQIAKIAQNEPDVYAATEVCARAVACARTGAAHFARQLVWRFATHWRIRAHRL